MNRTNIKERCLDIVSEQYESVYRNHPAAVYIYDMEGNYIYCNPAVSRVFGYAPGELINCPIGLMAVGDDRLRVRMHLQQAMEGEPQQTEIAIRNKAGDIVYIQITLVPALVDGHVVAVHGFSTDISELVRTQQELKNNQLSLSNAQAIANFGTWQYHVATKRLEWSDCMKCIHGMTPHSTPPSMESYATLMHPEDRRPPRMLTHLNEGIEVGIGKDVEYRIIRQSDRAVRVVSSRWGVLYGEDGQPTQYFGAVQDITERKKAEEDLDQAQAIAKVGNYSWNLLTNEIRGSSELRRIYGLELYNISLQEILDLTHPEDQKLLMDAVNCALRQDAGLHDVECRLILRDGTERVVHIHGTATFNECGQPITLFGTVQDITDRKKTEEVLHQSDKLAVVGELAAGIAHEIRNPLTTLKGFIQFMNSTNLSKQEQRRYYEIMMGELSRIEVIASEMLVLAKPQVTHIHERNIVSTLQEVVSLLNSQALLCDVEMKLHTEQKLMQVKCEESRIKQVFINLIKNAIEAMPDGGSLNIRAFQATKKAVISFTDTGFGIPPERIPKLGEPFYTTKEKGTGLGLMMSTKIIHDHQGSIEIESVVSEGTTVVIAVPLVN